MILQQALHKQYLRWPGRAPVGLTSILVSKVAGKELLTQSWATFSLEASQELLVSHGNGTFALHPTLKGEELLQLWVNNKSRNL